MASNRKNTTGIACSGIRTLGNCAYGSETIASLFHWQTDISLHVRLNLWKEALHLFLNKPLFGIGIRNFPHHVIPEALGQGHAALDHAHSNYMHILATTGLVGACAYIYLWISVILTALANCKDAGHALTVNNKSWSVESGINFGILAGVIALLVSGIFEYNFNTAQIHFGSVVLSRHAMETKAQLINAFNWRQTSLNDHDLT